MYNVIECPSALQVGTHLNVKRTLCMSSSDDYWQPEGSIASLEDPRGVVSELDMLFAAPSHCTYFEIDRYRIYEQADKAIIRDNKLVTIDQDSGECAQADSLFTIIKQFDTPLVTEEGLNDLDLLMLAQAHPKGVLLPTNYKLPATWAGVRRRDRDKHISVIDSAFLLSDDHDYVRLVYNPKRAKRLGTIHKRKVSNSEKDTGYRYTAHHCLVSIISTYHSLCYTEALRSLFGWGQYSTRGLDSCIAVIGNFSILSAELGLSKKAEKATRVWFKRLCYHKAAIENVCGSAGPVRLGAMKEFDKLFKRQIRSIGGMPEHAQARYDRSKISRKKREMSKFIEAMAKDGASKI